MTRVVRPTTWRVGPFLVCPECGTVRYGSGRCQCGARLLGPRRRPHYTDPSARVWMIGTDGTPERVP